MKISLVCTVHNEKGVANASNLHAILEHLKPEVVFLEISPDDMDSYFVTCSKRILESQAVIQYRKAHQTKIVPVDISPPDKGVLMSYQSLFNKISDNSTSFYQEVEDRISNCVYGHGFAYINSEHYSKDQTDLDKETLDIIKGINDPKITDLFESWNKIIEYRDSQMMNRIREYCSDNSFTNAVFFVGAAHRNSIISKSKDLRTSGPASVEWHYYS